MRIITKKMVPRFSKDIPYIKLSKSGLYFTKACAAQMGLKVGDHVQFLNEGKTWSIVKVDDPTDAFLLSKHAVKDGGLRLRSMGLTSMIAKSMLIHPRVVDNRNLYPLNTQRVLKNNTIWDLSLTKPL